MTSLVYSIIFINIFFLFYCKSNYKTFLPNQNNASAPRQQVLFHIFALLFAHEREGQAATTLLPA